MSNVATYTGKICLLGSGGHAASVHDVLTSLGWQVEFVAGGTGAGPWSLPVVASDAEALDLAATLGCVALPAVGDNRLREQLLAGLPESMRSPTICAASASVARSATLGVASVVHHHAHVGPRTTIGSAVIVNTGAIIEHDCSVGSAAHIAPGGVLLGGSSVGPRTLVGSGARVLPGVRLGADVTVGAGAVVTTDVADATTVIGVPARVQGR